MFKRIPREVVERKKQMRKDLKRELVKIALKHGVSYELVRDSVAINDAIDQLVAKLNYLHETLASCGTNTNWTNLDGVWLEPILDAKPLKHKVKELKDLKRFSEKMDELLYLEEEVKEAG